MHSGSVRAGAGTRRAVVVALGLLGAACGHVADPKEPATPPGIQSGSRLRARYYRTGDVAQFQTWFDSKLGVACSFEGASDGEWRCLPTDRAAYGYRTADCSTGELAMFEPGSAPAYRRGESVASASDPCAFWMTGPWQQYPVYRLDREITTPAYSWTANGCAADDPCVPADRRAFDPAMGTEMAPETFVRADLVVEKRTDRVGVEVLVADDGARQVRQPHDLESSSPCLTWGTGTCLPNYVAYADVIPWRDETCTTPIAHGRDALCPDPTVILQTPGHGAVCGAVGKVREVGPRFPAASVYEAGPNGCTSAFATHENDAFFELGPELPASRFAAVEQRTVGDGPIRVRFEVAPPDDAPLGPAELVTENGNFANVMRLGDGKLHAFAIGYGLFATLPAIPTGYLFSDDACTHEATVLYSSECAPDPVTTASRASECGTVYSVYASKPISTVYSYTDQGCVPYPITPPDTGAASGYAPTTEIDPSDLPEVEEVTE